MTYDQPHEVDDVTIAFPANLGDLLPPYDEIPEEFRDMNARGPYQKFQAKWFYEGIKDSEIPEARPDIDRKNALRHLMAIQGSFDPRHEHKVAAVSWLASKWLEEPKI